MTRAKEIRAGSGMSQEDFAYTYGIPLQTLKNWETGRSKPDSCARILLEVVARYPQQVEWTARELGE